MMTLPRIGLGCMSLSHAYGTPPTPDEGLAVLRGALDAGVTFLDTATLYGGGRNETLVGEAIRGRRDVVVLASKCGMALVDGVKTIDGRPETLKQQCDASLTRLGVDHIDLYYLHRWDRSVPIRESVGALQELVDAGKIGAIGLSEVGTKRLREAVREAPIAAVQNEFSLWSRNPELGILDATRALGVTLVAFSPVARGFLTGGVTDPEALAPKDIRRNMPRFQADHWPANAALLPEWEALVARAGVSGAQLALAWLLAQGEHVVAIPGSTNLAHIQENLTTPEVSAEILDEAARLINTSTVSGNRYNVGQRREVDAEDFEEL